MPRALLALAPLVALAAAASPAAADFQRGFTVASWYAGQLSAPETDRALARLADVGVERISLVVTGYVDDPGSTRIDASSPKTPTDRDLERAAREARRLGLDVMLTLHVAPRRGGWKGEVGRGFDEAAWAAFFRSYAAFLVRYARLARRLGCDQLCIGNELGTTHREREWRRLADLARRAFPGSLTYAALHGGEAFAIAWWDAVDFIGVDAYFALAETDDPTAAEVARAWAGPAARLEALARRFGRRVLFTEVGFRSADGAARAPWRWDDAPAPDPAEQAACYAGTLSALDDAPWLAGLYWWGVEPTAPADPAGYSPLGKPAERVLAEAYGAPRGARRLLAGAAPAAGWAD